MIQLNRRDMMTAGAAFAAVPLIGAGTAEPGWEKLPTEAYPGKRDDISFADPLHRHHTKAASCDPRCLEAYPPAGTKAIAAELRQ